MADIHSFLPLSTTAPAFLATASSTGSVFRLETSSTTARVWGSPTNRWIRISSTALTDLWVSFGTTDATSLPVVGSHMFLQFPGDHVVPVLAKNPGISLLPAAAAVASTDISICLGTLVRD